MKRNSAINDSAPESSCVALLVIDMLSDFDVAELSPLHRGALLAAKRISALRERATDAGIPTLYINDNFGRWRSSARGLIQRTASTERGKAIMDLIAPRPDDYILLKPKHSVFYATPLQTLLTYIGARALILTGLTDAQCILFSAADAHVRDYSLYIPSDCVVSRLARDAQVTQYLFRTHFKADVRRSGQLRLPALKARHAKERR